jgi:hypothetical protein
MNPTLFFDEFINETNKYSHDSLDWLTKKYFLKFTFKDSSDYNILETFLNKRIKKMKAETKKSLIIKYLSDYPNEKKDFLFGKEEYLQPIIGFLFVYYLWIKSENDTEIIEKFDDIYFAVILGTVGYGLIDTYCDNRLIADQNTYFSMQLITEYESIMFNAYGFSKENLDLLLKIKSAFHKSEYLEKSLLFKKSPYQKDFIADCGYKAFHLFYPLGLYLIRTGLENKMEVFLKIYLNCAAVIQVLDDIGDVEEDLQNGHYSFPILLLNKDNKESTPPTRMEIIRNVELLKQLKAKLIALISECEMLVKENSIPIFPFAYVVQAIKAEILLFF